ncbi:MAG TPA: LysM peptidoglycan-binding domain-containing protein, partial [Lysobacter sp.]
MKLGVVCAGFALASLAACSAKVVRDPSASADPSRATAPSAGRPGATTVVQRGDTLYSIATRNGIPLADLARWNGIQPPYTIYPG